MTNININEILEDYKPDNSILSEEGDKINKLKNIIYNDLSEPEKRIILMYADLQSFRKLGKELDVSPSTAFKKIREIRNKIYDKFNNNNTTGRIRN